MAFNLPVEGERGPFAGSALLEVVTCRPDEPPEEVLDRLGQDTGERVVVTQGGIVVGAVAVDKLRALGGDASLVDAMELSPPTIRPSVPLAELDERAGGVLVTTPDGALLGALDPSAILDDDSMAALTAG